MIIIKYNMKIMVIYLDLLSSRVLVVSVSVYQYVGLDVSVKLIFLGNEKQLLGPNCGFGTDS